MGEPIFELENVCYVYEGGAVALEGINLRIERGERVAVLGANGSGKSTLLKLLDGLYFPTAGEVKGFGLSMLEAAFRDEAFAYNFRRRVGLVFQDPDVQLFLPTVWQEVTFAPLQLSLSREKALERSEWALDFLGIGKLRHRAPHRLSLGEKKKVALASVLSLGPEVLLLDEPTANLDPRSASRLVDFIADLGREGKTVVTATHDLDILEEIADRALVFGEDHRLLAQGQPTSLLADRDLLEQSNLVHEHRHAHAATIHAHPHRHAPFHEHEHPQQETVEEPKEPAARAPEDLLQLQRLLPLWIEHNREHAAAFREWARKAEVLEKERPGMTRGIARAAEALDAATQALALALGGNDETDVSHQARPEPS
ncbi:MAG: ABC transporter ATP-binding protein [Chloroflexota bacterium]